MTNNNRKATMTLTQADAPAGSAGLPPGTTSSAHRRPDTTGEAATILADTAFDRQREVDRLNQQLTDHRFAMEAIGLALVTIDRYDPTEHKLTSRLGSYHRLFQTVAPVAYARCINVALAATVLDILIAERAAA